MLVVFPLVTSVVALAFGLMVFRQYSQRRGTHQLVWAIALAIFAFAAFCEFYSEAWGWTLGLYRVYYVAAAALVAYLGLGTVYLVWKRRVGNTCLAVVLVVTAAMLVAAFSANVDAAQLVSGVTVAGRAMPSSVRLFSPLLTVPGSIALIGGAIYSAWLFRRNPAYGYRVVANVLIAAGALIIAGSGALSRFGFSGLLYPAEMVGIITMFLGFTKAGAVRSAPRSASLPRYSGAGDLPRQS
jgi:hypothetical protein